MQIKPATSPNLSPSKEVFTNPVVEKQLLENLDLLQVQESLVKPHFGEVLSNLNEVQSKPLPSKNLASKTKRSADIFGAGPRQDHNPVSRDSLVKSKESREANSLRRNVESENKKAKTDFNKKTLSADSRGKEENLTQIRQSSDVNPNGDLTEILQPLDHFMPICLNGEFICDTLQRINERQALSFELLSNDSSAIRANTPVSEMLSVISDLGKESTISLVHIEVQAAVVQAAPLLDDQQMSIIANLVAQEVENIELTPKQELALPSMVDSMEESGEDFFPETDFQTRVYSGQSEKIKAGTTEGRPVVHDLQQVSPRYEASTAHIVTQSSSSSLSLSSASLVQGGIGGHTGAGGKPEMTSLFAEMTHSNLERVNTLMQVKDHFRSLLRNQESHLKVNLTPHDLGSIEITIDIIKDTVMATFIKAERRETMELLARHAEDIDKIFQEAGLESNLANMNFSSDQDQKSGKEKIAHQKPSFSHETQPTEDVALVLENDIDPDALVDIKA